MAQQIKGDSDFTRFFQDAPRIHPNCTLIKGTIFGVRVEEIENPVVQNVRRLDKLIDELARGKTMDKILKA